MRKDGDTVDTQRYYVDKLCRQLCAFMPDHSYLVSDVEGFLPTHTTVSRLLLL